MMLAMYASYWLFVARRGRSLRCRCSSPRRSSSPSASVIQKVVIEPNRAAAEHNQLLLTLGLALFFENLALVLWQGDFRTLRVPYCERVLRDRRGAGRGAAARRRRAAPCSWRWRSSPSCASPISARPSARSPRSPRAPCSSASTWRASARPPSASARPASAVAGALITPFFYVAPDVGESFNIMAFVVVVLGGMGNFVGALARRLHRRAGRVARRGASCPARSSSSWSSSSSSSSCSSGPRGSSEDRVAAEALGGGRRFLAACCARAAVLIAAAAAPAEVLPRGADQRPLLRVSRRRPGTSSAATRGSSRSATPRSSASARTPRRSCSFRSGSRRGSGMLVGGVLAAAFGLFAGLSLVSLRPQGPVLLAGHARLRGDAARGGGEHQGRRLVARAGRALGPRPRPACSSSRASCRTTTSSSPWRWAPWRSRSAIERARLGYSLAAVRENEDAAEAAGVDALGTKLRAMALSSFLTALGGTFYAQYFALHRSRPSRSGRACRSRALLPAIVGGAGTVLGPLLGSFVLTPVSELTRAALRGRAGRRRHALRARPHARDLVPSERPHGPDRGEAGGPRSGAS